MVLYQIVTPFPNLFIMISDFDKMDYIYFQTREIVRLLGGWN
jgi:hypothetical protein